METTTPVAKASGPLLRCLAIYGEMPWCFAATAPMLLGLAGADQALKRIVPNPWLVSVRNVMAIGGCVLVLQGIRLLAGRDPRWRMLVALLTLIVLPLVLSHDPAVRSRRVAYNNMLLVVFDLWAVIEALRLVWRERLNTARTRY